ncbi:GIN domain-containing protein [Hyphomonas chukchiensis]|uniref:Putative auto-transporter adhesin head GIN domain-containing protein n=1 Tax=Hyphomonas chukchiensis TaxID=1280947 RepID=A0A062UP14_9PROT|nr:DUF2807 domain-containing protein [Hyphomonas chukchiensis]KCZ58313.1 hypothetical protein HY30_16535 [Hyphomonas chukchiensis]|tara:strand:+ start:1443 stop:2078 length:636 start_codon:yes stop_codon:yes gene_type:complete
MRKMILATICLTLSTYSAAHADTSESYDFTGFDELDISAGVDVSFETAPEYSVIIDFEKGGPENMKLRQDGSRLYIARKMTSGWSDDKVRAKVRVTGPTLKEIEASSGSSIRATGLDSDILVLDASSGASIKADGKCGSLKIVANSGGSANGKQVICEKVAANASSGGSVSASASLEAHSHTSSGGSVDIYGDPQEREQNKSMSGGTTSFH